MLTEDRLSNKRKSQTGNDFNKDIENILYMLKNDKIIESFKKEPKLSAPGYINDQFRPDFKINLIEKTIVFIDNTKTIRGDRVKQKQWEALGVKMCYTNKECTAYYFVIVPNEDIIGSEETREKEVHNVIHERNKIRSGDYYSEIDDILFVDEFINWLHLKIESVI